MMRNPMLGQVLGGLFGAALSRRGVRGGLGGAVLGGMLGGRRSPVGLPTGRGGGARTALLLMMLPMAMRWVQRNGGMGAVLERFRSKGYERQAQSWVDDRDNEEIDGQAVEQVVGQGELAQMAQRLGVPEQEVAQAFAEIMPEMVDRLSPGGQLPREADEVLDEGARSLEKEIEDVQFREVRRQ